MTIWKRAIRDGDAGRDGGFQSSTSKSIKGFVALHVRCPSNRLERSFPLDLRLEIDEYRLKVKRKQTALGKIADLITGEESPQSPIELRVRLHHCYVRYRCEGVTIPADSKYRSAIEIGTYSDKQLIQNRSASFRDRAGSANVGANSAQASPVSATATFKIGGTWQATSSSERTTVATQDLYEIEAVPGGWRVGDKVHGDPRKHDNCLDGQYFALVNDKHSNTCNVQFVTGSRTGSINFQVSVRDGIRVDRVAGNAIIDGDPEIVAIEAMRDRIAALCIEQSTTSDDDELVVFEMQTECFSASDHGE